MIEHVNCTKCGRTAVRQQRPRPIREAQQEMLKRFYESGKPADDPPLPPQLYETVYCCEACGNIDTLLLE